MKSVYCFVMFFGVLHFSFAQQHYLDSLKKQFDVAKNQDTIRVKALIAMADYYGFVQFDSCLFYATQAAELSDKLNYNYGEFLSYRSKFYAFNCTGNFPMALQAALNFEKTYEQLKEDGRPQGTPHYFVGVLYREMADYPAAILKLQQTINLQIQLKQPLNDVFFAYSQLGLLYLSLNQLDSALFFAQRGYDLGLHSTNEYKKYFSLAIGTLGSVHVALHDYKEAETLFRHATQQSSQFNNIYFEARNYNNLANLFDKENLKDSAIYYAGISLRLCLDHNFGEFTLEVSKLLVKIYDSEKKADSTLKYMRIMVVAKDSVFSQSKGQQFRQFAYDEIQRQQEVNTEKERYQNKIRLSILLTALSMFFLLAFVLYRNNMQKQKAKVKIEKAYAELKTTQSQLIQSEKMASLGELTAGIAHEIQNPLNFVNNFSEVNTELIDELQIELKAGKKEEAIAIAGDIKENEQKINFHGKRADAIVKGMLQHSRSSTDKKEPTDINALADEYLRLSYHGLRAKDKSFNAKLKTDFDTFLQKININPQDIGRVLLNLFTNAFYSVAEKKKMQNESYQPSVFVSTKKIDDKVEIRVKDNGTGIPQKVLDKIYQPFFTTKPTGEGTGLGLSLSYDIVKAHGGQLKVETKEGEGATFIIILPV